MFSYKVSPCFVSLAHHFFVVHSHEIVGHFVDCWPCWPVLEFLKQHLDVHFRPSSLDFWILILPHHSFLLLSSFHFLVFVMRELFALCLHFLCVGFELITVPHSRNLLLSVIFFPFNWVLQNVENFATFLEVQLVHSLIYIWMVLSSTL